MEMTMQDRQRQLNSGECPVCHGTGWEITLEILEGYSYKESYGCLLSIGI